MSCFLIQNLELVEIEPLFKEPESQAWRPDPMEGAAFSSLHDLRVLHAVYTMLSVWSYSKGQQLNMILAQHRAGYNFK